MSAPALPDADAATLATVPAGYRVVALGPTDVDTLSELETRLFPADAWPTEMFRDELAHPEWRRYWGLTTQDGELIGYAGAQYSPRLADVQTIAMLPQHEGHGLGTFLLRLMIERATAWGATDLMLEVRVDNPRAIALYERHGFRRIHVRPGYYQDGTDAAIMSKELHHDQEGTA